MASLNKVQLIGNCGQDPEIKEVGPNNTKYSRLSLAVTETYKDRNGERKENTEWFTIVTFGSLSEIIQRFVHKGSRIYVEGRLKTRKWSDQSGDHYSTEVHGQQIILLDAKPNGNKPGQDYFKSDSDDLPW